MPIEPPLPPASGTITITQGQSAITGTGTSFKSLNVGDLLITGSSIVVIGVKPTENESAVLSTAFTNTTETDVDYVIVPRALSSQAAYYFQLVNLNISSQEGQLVWLWSTATEASDPGAGRTQIDDPSWASATALYISDTDQSESDQGDWLATWAGSKVQLTSLDRPSVFGYATLGTVTDSTGYRSIVLSDLVGTPEFNASERIAVALMPAGPQGVAGATWSQSSGAPDNGDGANGDFHYRSDTNQIYFKAGGTWSAIAQIDDGADGDDAYVYIAYASDDSGTDFTTTFDSALDYMAVLTTDAEIGSPSSGDFSGLWKRVVGEDGIVPSGTWATSTAYDARDGVAYQGGSFLCTANHTSSASTEPGVGASWETVWQRIASPGSDGAFSGDQIEFEDDRDVTDSDKGKALVHTSDTSHSLTFDSAATLNTASQFSCVVKNEGAGLLTLVADAGDDALDLTLAEGESVMCLAKQDDSGIRTVFTGGPSSGSSGSTSLISAVQSDQDLLIAMGIADNLEDIFVLPEGRADPFANENGVDTGSAVNEVWDEANTRYSPSTTDTLVSPTGLTTLTDFNSNPSNAFDGTTSQDNSASASKTGSNTSAYIGKTFSTASKISYGRIYPSTLSYFAGGNITNLEIQLRAKTGSAPSDYSSDGTLLGTTGVVAEPSSMVEITNTGDTDTAFDHWWFYLVRSGGSDDTFFCAEAQIYAPTEIDNMTLPGNAFTIAEQSDLASIAVRVSSSESYTTNADLTAEITRDDGANWKAVVLSLATTNSDGSKTYIALNQDMSALPSGTDMNYRIKTLNNKDINVENVALFGNAVATYGTELVDDFNELLLGLFVAEAKGSRIVHRDGFADSFVTETGVNTGAAVNAVWDEANSKYAPSTTGGAISGATATPSGNLTGAGGLAAIFDGDTTKVNADCGRLINDPADGVAGKDWGDGNEKVISVATLYGPTDSAIARDTSNTGTSVSAKLQGSNVASPSTADGADWVDLDTQATGSGTTAVIAFSSASTTAYRHHRIYIPAVDSSSDKYVAQIVFEEPIVANNLTLPTNAITLSSQPSELAMMLQVEENEAITVNTDLLADLSVNGGSSFVTVALSLFATQDDDTKVYSAVADMSAQTGTSLVGRVRTLNNKDIDIHGITARETQYRAVTTSSNALLTDRRIAAMALEISALSGTQLGLPNGFVDAFSDESGIDADLSVNESYDATNDWYSPSTVAAALIDRTIGTEIGDMSNNGGLSAAFDGNTSQGEISSAAKGLLGSGVYAYCGKDFGASNEKVIGSVRIYPSSDRGFYYETANITLEWYTSNSLPASATDGTLRGSATFADTTTHQDIDDLDSTAYRYSWISMKHDGATDRVNIAEIQHYEPPFINDATVAYESVTAAAESDTVGIIAQIIANESITMGTDVKGWISRAEAAFTTDYASDANELNDTAHGLSNDHIVFLKTSDTLPAGLSKGIAYYVVNATTDAFELSLTSGGSAITLTDDGTGTHGWVCVTEVTLEDVNAPINTFTNYTDDEINIADQPSGTSMRVIIQVLGKDVDLSGVTVFWE